MRIETIPDFTPERFNRMLSIAGLTKVQAAAILGISYRTLYRWGNGENTPNKCEWIGANMLIKTREDV